MTLPNRYNRNILVRYLFVLWRMDAGNAAVSVKDYIGGNSGVIIMIRILIESNKGIRISGFKRFIWTNLYEGTSALTSINVSISGNTNYYYYLRLVIKVQSQALLLLMLMLLIIYGWRNVCG
jgi:hypothetical protein